MHKFVLRTSDQAWIDRNGGKVAPNGRVLIEVNHVERDVHGGIEFYRTTLDDLPADALNRHVMCPVAWVADFKD